MLYQVFLAPQMTRWAIIRVYTIIRIYELAHEFPNDLRLSDLGN